MTSDFRDKTMIASMPSNEELACRAQSGCRESFDLLLRRFQIPVLHFLRRRGFVADAEDLTQETFLRVYKNLRHYRPQWTFSAWLFTIARRVGISHYRRARTALDMMDGTTAAYGAVASAVEPLDALVAEESRCRLWNLAADVLTEEQWTVLWLHYAEDMPTRDIALVLERSRASVKILLFRARKTLLPLLEKHDLWEIGRAHV